MGQTSNQPKQITIYSKDGASKIVPEPQVYQYINQGWSRTPISAPIVPPIAPTPVALPSIAPAIQPAFPTKYLNTAKNEFYDLTDPNAPKLIGDMYNYAKTLAEQNFSAYRATFDKPELADLEKDWFVQRESGKVYQDLLKKTEMRELTPAAAPAETPVVKSGFDITPGQASPEQIARFKAGAGEYAPTFKAAAAGSEAAADFKVQLKDKQGNLITVYNSSIPALIAEGTLPSAQAPAAPGISTGQVTNKDLYIGATNWANLQKQFTPAQLEAATALEDRDGDGVKERYWKSRISEVSPTGAITGETLKGGQGKVDLGGTTTGAGATATSDANTAASSIVADIEARRKVIEQTQTAEQKQAESFDKTILDLIGKEAGKATFTEEQRKLKMGEGEVNLNAQLTKSKNRIESLQAEKQKVLTDIQGKPITLSSIAGQQAQQIAKYNSEILLETALANGLMNNISLAEQQIEQAVNAKFAPTEEALRIARAQRDAIRGQVSADEKIQLDALDKADEAKKQQIADAKTEQTNIKGIMLEAIKAGITESNVLSKISNAKTLTEAMRVLGENMPATGVGDLTAEYKNWTLAGGQAGTGMSFAEWQGKAAPSDKSPYQTETATKAIQSIDELIPQINNNTTGWGAFLTGKLPASEARNFSAQLDTLKSNIAFGALTAMREASKTGGALGQVSDREIKLLESTLGALDQLQSGSQLKTQLEKVKASIQRWNSAAGASTNSNMSDFAW